VPRLLKNHTNYWSDWLAYFGHYKPWGVHRQNGGTWDDFPPHSKNILEFKKAKTEPIPIFVAMIEPELPNNIAVAVVPGHDPAKPGKGLPTIAAALAAKGATYFRLAASPSAGPSSFVGSDSLPHAKPTP
jgi:hypothetical protein